MNSEPALYLLILIGPALYLLIGRLSKERNEVVLNEGVVLNAHC
jgi:hypothetical protein